MHDLLLIIGGCLLGAGVMTLFTKHVQKKFAHILSRRPATLDSLPHNAATKLLLSDVTTAATTMTREFLDSEERYRILSENVAAAVIVHNSDGEISWCSPFTEVLTGFSLSEVYGKKSSFFSSVVHSEDAPLLSRALKILQTGEPFQYRFRMLHKTGITVWCEARTVPILEEVDGPTMALTILLDATATVLYQLQIEERNRELHDFTYMVSHDLKSPIFTIKGMTTLLRQEHDNKNLPTETLEVIEHIDRASRRLEYLVGGILELAQLSGNSSKREYVDLTKTLQGVRDDYAHELSQIGASLLLEGEFTGVYGDERMVYQMFANLVGNAIKYRSADRALQIRVIAKEIPTLRRLEVSICDNGRGIPKEHHAHVFRPFNRLGVQEIEGNGVGLACVKRIADRLGAEISFDSDGCLGTTFTVALRSAQSN